ncbi:MAG TPA: hypothetical protein VE011_01830 [Candidatus Dormibacteraeota bacterium]|nr:hypothetical protein [Candidatus Dormibacteraeota bacterium]
MALQAIQGPRGRCGVSRREAVLSAGVVFLVALLVRTIAATQITFPRPEDVAYYLGVARNLVEGHGLTTDAIWSFQTPPLSFPRPAFEVWLPLPTLLAAIPMAIFGTTFAAAQVSSVIVGSIVAVLAWRLAADVAEARGLPPGRARTLALGTGLTAAVYLPLVLASVQPDSTMPFAALVLGACLLMTRLSHRVSIERVRTEGIDAFVDRTTRDLGRRSRVRVALGVVLALAALTRNEAIWLALTFALIEWSNVRRAYSSPSDRLGAWGINVIPVGLVAILTFAPWAFRDWIEFGSPLPGQALTNALSLDGRDIFAWQDPPTLARYLSAGLAKLVELRWDGIVHNVVSVLLLLGVPLSVVGLVGLPGVVRGRAGADGGPSGSSAVGRSSSLESGAVGRSSSLGSGEVGRSPSVESGAVGRSPFVVDPIRPLVFFSIITFLVASLVFPVSTTWGTFLHAAGAIHVLLVISALLALDRLIGWVGRRRAWTNPVAWLGPAFAIAGCLLFSAVLLPTEGRAGRDTADQYAAIAYAFSPAGAAAADATSPGSGVDLATEPGPVITDFPIWFAEATRHHAIALPNESPASILDLARTFNPPARLLVVGAANTGAWPAAVLNGAPGSDCFVPLQLPDDPAHPGALATILAFRIRC